MIAAQHIYGGAACIKTFKLGAALGDPGIIIIGGAAAGGANVIPCTTTNNTESFGFTVDEAVYSTTQGDAEGVIKVDISPDLIIKALMSGAAGEGTALAILTNTAASAGGTVVTAANVAANDMDGGTVWGLAGNNVGLSRTITSMTASTSATVTVPFPRAIAVNDTYLMCPYSAGGDQAASGGDGAGRVQTSTLFTQADATIATGTGLTVAVVELELNGASDSYVLFVNMENVYGFQTL